MGHYTNKPQQHMAELAEFAAFIQAARISSYLEVGCKFGGLVYAVSRVMPKGSRIVGLDLPNSAHGRSDSEQSLMDCFAHLTRDGYQARLLLGDSTDRGMIDQARALGPYDCVFIDANHRADYVRKDFENYGKLARRFCCFHDIAAGPRKPGRLPIEVPIVWAELKRELGERATFREIKLDETRNDNGIGIIEWR